MPEIRGAGKANHADAIARLKEAGGFDATVKLGEQALTALTTTNIEGAARSDAQEILKAVLEMASHLDVPPGALNASDPKTIVAHFAQGNSMETPLTKAQASMLQDHLESSIKAGKNLPQIAEAVKNMDYGNPSMEGAGRAHTGAAFGTDLKDFVAAKFKEHQPQAYKDLGVAKMTERNDLL